MAPLAPRIDATASDPMGGTVSPQLPLPLRVHHRGKVGVTCLRPVEDRDRAAQKALEEDDRQTDIHTHDPSII